MYGMIFSILVVIFIFLGMANISIGDTEEAIKNFSLAVFFCIPAIIMVYLSNRNKKVVKEQEDLFTKRIKKWGLSYSDCYVQMGDKAIALGNNKFHIIELNKITKRTISFEDILDFKIDLHTTQKNTKRIITLTHTYDTSTIINKVSCSIILKNSSIVLESEVLNKSTENMDMKKYINELERLKLLVQRGISINKVTPKNIESEPTQSISSKESKDNKTEIDKIKELKELLDINAITQEEFDSKKKELLSKV